MEDSSNERRSYNRHAQRIFSTVIWRPESMLMRQVLNPKYYQLNAGDWKLALDLSMILLKW